MWLSSNDQRIVSARSPTAEPSGGRGSPPLQGGEALSEFCLEYSGIGPGNLPKEVQQNAESSTEANKSILYKHVDSRDLHHGTEPAFFLAPNQSFINILEKELNPHNSFTQNFLQSIISSLDSRDPVVANAWLETLLDVIDLLPREVIKKDILNVVISKGQLSQPVTTRLSCCKMIGKICTKFEPYLIKKEIVPVVQSLCQDTNYEVRGCMCRQLDMVARGMGLDAAKTLILPELVELANDEQTCVRLAGIETVVNILTLFDDETRSQIIVPLVKNLCQNSMSNEDATLPVLSFHLGRLCHRLSANLSLENKQWFVNFFRQLSKLGLSNNSNRAKESDSGGSNPMPDLVPLMDTLDKFKECRQNCAYNFPAMVLFVGPHDFPNSLYRTFSELCSDPSNFVRQTIASGFHEIAKLLGPSVESIHLELVVLLNDASIDVLKGLISHLPDTLEAFTKEANFGVKSSITESIVSALIECETMVSKSSNWRLQASFLDKMSCLTWCLNSEIIYEVFVPLFVKKLHKARPIPCRIAANRTLLTFLKLNRCLEERKNTCKILIDELCHGRSCYSRMLFIDCCFLVLEMFSKSFFKQNFFQELLSLTDDKIVNVRLRLCSILPLAKSTIKLPSDNNLLQLLESCIRKLLMNETDQDVTFAIQNAIIELDKIELMIESMHLSQGALVTVDIEDIKKEEEEKLIEMESKVSFALKEDTKIKFDRKKIGRRIPVRKPETERNTPNYKSPETKLKHSKSSSSIKLDFEKASEISSNRDGSRIAMPTNPFVRNNALSSSLSREQMALRRCSTGSLSRIPSPFSSPVMRRQSIQVQTNSSRIPTPTSSPSSIRRKPSISTELSETNSDSEFNLFSEEKQDKTSTNLPSSQNTKLNSRIPCATTRKDKPKAIS